MNQKLTPPYNTGYQLWDFGSVQVDVEQVEVNYYYFFSPPLLLLKQTTTQA